MNFIGGLLALVGAVLLFAGFNMETTAQTDPMPSISGPYGTISPYIGPSRVVNIGRLHQRELVVYSGLASVLGAVVAFGFGAVLNLLEDRLPSRAERVAANVEATAPTEDRQEAVPAEEVSAPSDPRWTEWAVPGGILIFVVGLIAILALAGRSSPTYNSAELNRIDNITAEAERRADAVEAEGDRIQNEAQRVLEQYERTR